MPHVLDLLLEDIGKVDFISGVLKQAAQVRSFIRGHQHVLSFFKSASTGTLACPGATRFSSAVISLESLQKHRRALSSTVSDPAVSAAIHKGRSAKVHGGTLTLGELFEEVRRTILDESFWENVAGIVKIMEPISNLLTFL